MAEDMVLSVVIRAEDEASATIAKIGNDFSGLGTSVNKGVGATDNALKRAGKSIKDFGGAVDDITKPLQVASVGIITAGAASGKLAIDFEKNFAAVKKTVDGTPEQLEAVEKGIIDLTTVGIGGRSALPATTADLTAIAAAAGQLGIETDNIVEFTEVMAQMGSATNLAGEEGAATLARLMNVTNTDQGLIRNMGSSIVALGNNFATTEAEIAAMAMRMGATGTIVGMSVQDVLAYSTALSSLGIEAEAGGSAFSRILMSISTAVSTGSGALDAFAATAGMSGEEFAKAWKSDATEAFTEFIRGLSESEDVIAKLDELGFGNIRDIQGLQNLSGERGIELITQALELSNAAWEENTALQKEADAMAETTAGQIAVTKNNITETARSFGEVLMPTISDASGVVRDLAQDMAAMSDSEKRGIVNALGTVATVGIGAKALSGVITTIGTVTDGFGTMATAAQGLGPIILGVGAVVGAVGLGKAAYDSWYDSQYRWAEGLDDGNDKIERALDNYSELTGYSREISDLKLIIENPESSAEQVEIAQARLQEIAELLSKEYNLVINSDNSNLEEAVTNAQRIASNELQKQINDQKIAFYKVSPKVQEYRGNFERLEGEYNNASNKYIPLQELYSKISALETEYGNKAFQYAEDENFQTVQSEQLALIEEYASKIPDLKNYYSTDTAGSVTFNKVNMVTALEEYEEVYSEAKKRMDDLNTSYNEAKTAAENTLELLTQKIVSDTVDQNSSSVNQSLSDMGEIIEIMGYDLEKYAQNAALAMNGVDSLSTAWEQAANGDGTALNGIVNDYIYAMETFGATTEESVGQAALIANGFTTVEEAAAKGQEAIDAVIEDIVRLGEQEGLFDGLDTQTAANKVAEIIDAMKLEGEDERVSVRFESDFSEVEKDEAPTKTGIVIYTAKYLDGYPILGTGSQRTIFRNAKGTQNFTGGLAMVNDETGTPDPRELIIDRGRAFIPQGRDVILPLSKGAKVYTASQTKEIMRGLGIPRYAKGKDNSDAFTNYTDEWNHYTKTHAVTVSEELEKWNAILKDVAQTDKDIEDSMEKIYSLQVKTNEEANEASSAWISARTALNDWEEYGDDPIAAFERFKQRNLAELEAGRMTWDEYNEVVTSQGEEMLDERVSQSLSWIEHQKKYNELSLDEEMEYYKAIEAYTLQYYENGLINHQKYRETWTEIDEKHLDAYAEKLDELEAKNAETYNAWKKDMSNWIDIRSTYDDWDEYGDSLSQTYARAIARQNEFFKNGLISWQECEDAKLEYSLEMYNAASEEYDTVLSEQKQYIDELREKFSKQEQELRDKWTVEDRKEDIADVERELAIYKNASTDAGQQKYKELLEQKEQLEREEQMYQLQEKNSATIEKLEAEYEQMEAEKKGVLSRLKIDCGELADTGADISATAAETRELARQIGITYATAADSTRNSLGEVVSLLEGIKKVLGGRSTNTYNDNKKVTINSGISEQAIATVINGTIVSTLGSVRFVG